MKSSNNNISPAELPDFSENTIDWRAIRRLFLEKSWLIVLCGIAGFFAANAYVRRIPEVYRATAVIQFDPEARKVLNFEDGQKQDLGNESGVQTVVEAFHSRSLLGKVVDAEKLNEDPVFMPPAADGKPQTNETPRFYFRAGDNRSPAGDGKPQTFDTAVRLLAACIDAQMRRGTRLIDISAVHRDPRMAKKLADSAARELLLLSIEQQASGSQAVMRFLLGEVEKFKAKLQHSEEAIQSYKENHSISLEEKQDTVVTKLKSQNVQLNEARAKRLLLGTENAEVSKRAGNPAALLSLASVASKPAVVADLQTIRDRESEISSLALRYTEKHPKMIKARSELDEAKSALAATLRNLPKLIESEYDQALASENDFEKAVRDQEQQALALNQQSIQYNVLMRDLETDRAVYESLLRKLKETDVTKGVDSGNLRIFETATLPVRPVDRKVDRILLLGLTGGLLLGIGTVLTGHILDTSWKTADQAEAATSLPVLTSIPHWRRLQRTIAGFPMLKSPNSAAAEAFRYLRTALLVTARKKSNRKFLFTSALPGEGKTLCSINYAIAAAQQGLRTLIIDADLRSPMVGSMLLSDATLPGVVECICDDATIETAIHDSTVGNLSVLPAGRNALNPSEILAASKFAKLIAETVQRFDCVVIDTAPLLAVSDTLLIVGYADAVCLVVRAGRTQHKSVLRACHLLSEASVKPVGLVMNDVSKHALTPYYCPAGSYGKRAYVADEAG